MENVAVGGCTTDLFVSLPEVCMPFFELITSPLAAIFFFAALAGGMILFFQFLLLLFGFGSEVEDGFETDLDHSDSFGAFKVLSFRTIVAGVTFFGLGGLAGLTGGLSPALSVLLAVLCALIAIYIVYYLYRTVANLKSDGSISSKTLIGCPGNVYVRIPASGGGVGKVLVTQQERTMEYEAISSGDELKTGTPIIVVRIVSPTTVEVKAVQ